MPRAPHSSAQAANLFSAMLGGASDWRHGYELSRSTGLKSGTLYPLLMRLADDGLLEARWVDPVPPARLPRHAYRLTAQGAAFAHALLATRRARSERTATA